MKLPVDWRATWYSNMAFENPRNATAPPYFHPPNHCLRMVKLHRMNCKISEVGKWRDWPFSGKCPISWLSYLHVWYCLSIYIYMYIHISYWERATFENSRYFSGFQTTAAGNAAIETCFVQNLCASTGCYDRGFTMITDYSFWCRIFAHATGTPWCSYSWCTYIYLYIYTVHIIY